MALVAASDRVLRARIGVAPALLKASRRPNATLIKAIKSDWDAASQPLGSGFTVGPQGSPQA